jgi:hypothetical protein
MEANFSARPKEEILQIRKQNKIKKSSSLRTKLWGFDCNCIEAKCLRLSFPVHIYERIYRVIFCLVINLFCLFSVDKYMYMLFHEMAECIKKMKLFVASVTGAEHM